MNVEIGTEAAQFPEKEYINGIFVAMWDSAGQRIQCRILQQIAKNSQHWFKANLKLEKFSSVQFSSVQQT
jgi:hypothetical protein